LIPPDSGLLLSSQQPDRSSIASPHLMTDWSQLKGRQNPVTTMAYAVTEYRG